MPALKDYNGDNKKENPVLRYIPKLVYYEYMVGKYYLESLK